MNEPRRLKDDPDFIQSAGRALDDEQLVVGNYDLKGLRARVVGGPPVPAGPSWWRIAAVSGATAALVTFALLQLQPGAAPVGPVVTPQLEVLDPAPGAWAPRVTDPDLDSDGAAVATPPIPPPTDPDPVIRPEQAEPAEAPEAVPAEAMAPPPAEEDAAPEDEPEETSALVAELADYNRGVELADARRWSEAKAAWSDYLTRWPEGRLRTEARLGMLSALVNADRPDAVERLAAELLEDPTLGAQHDDLRLVRSEALVKLDRCAEALALIDGVRRNSRVGAVRTACRKAD